MAAVSSPRSSRATSQSQRPEPIRPGEILILPDFKSRAVMKDAAWAQVKRQCAGLGIQIAFVVGRNVYVSTDAWLEYLKTRPVRAVKRNLRPLNSDDGTPP
jgi:hypothetical protein